MIPTHNTHKSWSLTKEDQDMIVCLYQSKVIRVKYLCEWFKVSRQSIYNVLKKYNIAPNRLKMHPTENKP